MYVQLLHRHRHIQRPIKYTWIPCRFEHVVSRTGHIDENLLLHLIPAGWLPVKPAEILISIAHAQGSTGLTDVKQFRPWVRFVDCYVLELWREEPHG